jgi:DNA-binding transcriptional ArsR family regulator
VLRALAHEQRRQFVRACLPQERAAGELAEVSHLALASVSEHLKVLRKCGLLLLEVRGRFWMYRTDPKVLRAATAALVQLGHTGRNPSTRNKHGT